MSNTIGKKIKHFRKTLKMTQTELAGTEMTKSMISHIETGHSNPSMKNLEYIAKKLNKPVAYFLEDDNANCINRNQEEKYKIDKIIMDLKNIDVLIKAKEYEKAKLEADQVLKSYTLDSGSRIYADVVYKLGYCNLKLKKVEDGKELINKSCSIYIENLLYEEAIRSYLELIKLELQLYNYKECLTLIDKIDEIYSKYSGKDVFLQNEILVIRPSIYFALGNFEKAINVCEKAILLSKENNIYYRLDDAYRILAITYMLQGDFKKFDINANEAKKYVEFTGNKLNLAKIYHNYAKYENAKGNPLEAIKYLELLQNNSEENTFYYYLEYAKAQYLLEKYNEAKEALMQINYNKKPAYQMDCIYMATARIYRGLIYYKLGQGEEAVIEVKQGIKEIEDYTTCEYEGFVVFALNELSFAYSSLSEIYSLSGNYENAYLILKKSNEIKALYNKKLPCYKSIY